MYSAPSGLFVLDAHLHIMKFLPIFLAAALFAACGNSSNNSSTAAASPAKSDSATAAAAPKKSPEEELEGNLKAAENRQDSLRAILLSRKENAVLKASFLQEMYIRNVATVANDSVFIKIPFDFHGQDGGAPDCYTTELSFAFPLGSALVFPKTIAFSEREYGCVDREFMQKGIFVLQTETPEYVIYYSANTKSTLVLFSHTRKDEEPAYYFHNTEKNTVGSQHMDDVYKHFSKDESNVPMRSFALSTNDYGRFLR